MSLNNTTLGSLRKAFDPKRFRGSRSWAARRLGVHRGTVTEYLKGLVKSARLDAEMPALARELEQTQGACIQTARAEVQKIRRRKRP